MPNLVSATAPVRVPAKVSELLLLTVKVAAAPLSVTWLLTPVPTVTTLATVWLLPFKSNTPLLVPLPSARVVPVGRGLVLPSRRVPARIDVPPGQELFRVSVSTPVPALMRLTSPVPLAIAPAKVPLPLLLPIVKLAAACALLVIEPLPDNA